MGEVPLCTACGMTHQIAGIKVLGSSYLESYQDDWAIAPVNIQSK